MDEFNIARVRSHMCRGLVIFGLLVSNTMSIGNQQTVIAPVAIASVQATRNSNWEVSFNETVPNPKLLSCLPVVGKKWNKQEVKKENTEGKDSKWDRRAGSGKWQNYKE